MTALAHLEWTPGVGSIEQEVWYKKASDPTFILYDTVSSATTEINIPDLEVDTVYDFRIVNKCAFDMDRSLDVEGAYVSCPDSTIEQTALSLRITFPYSGSDVDMYTVELYEMPSETYINSDDILSPSPGSLTMLFDSLIPDTYYKFKVVPKIGDTYENSICTVTERTLGCEEDYELAPDGSYCYKIEEIAPLPPTGGTPQSTVAKTLDAYGTYGTHIYDFGFSTNGTGTTTKIPISNTFWINGDGSGDNNPALLGPLNRCGLWSISELSNQDIGFSVCISISETKVYYIGVGGDNNCRIAIDGVVLVDQNPSALDIALDVGGAPFKIWHVYPFSVSAGTHIIEMVGHNVGGPASMGAEIYSNTAAEIMAATGYGDLNMIFSTFDYIGGPVQLGSDNLGYSCPSGYALSACDGPFMCRRMLTALPD